jgi:hypothetical protein
MITSLKKDFKHPFPYIFMKNRLIWIIPILILVLILIGILIYTNKSTNPTTNYNKLFEAKIGNELIFNNSDVIYVGKTDEEVKIDQCNQGATEQTCEFHIFVKINPIASKRFAEITSNIDTNPIPSCVERDSDGNLIKLFVLENPNLDCLATKEFSLNKKLDFYLNGKLFNSLLISEKLKGMEITEVTIFGSGNGTTIEEAYNSANENMKSIQFSLGN